MRQWTGEFDKGYGAMLLKFKAQGMNDLIVYSSMALASLSAGVLLSLAGWKMMNLFCIPLLILTIYMTFRADVLSKK